MGVITKPVLGILINGLSLFLLTKIVTDITYTGGLKFFILGGIIVGLINFFVKPLVKLLSLPFILLSGGLVLILINVGVLWFLSYFLGVIEFREITLSFPNFSTYAIGAVVFGVINWTLHICKLS